MVLVDEPFVSVRQSNWSEERKKRKLSDVEILKLLVANLRRTSHFSSCFVFTVHSEQLEWAFSYSEAFATTVLCGEQHHDALIMFFKPEGQSRRLFSKLSLLRRSTIFLLSRLSLEPRGATST